MAEPKAGIADRFVNFMLKFTGVNEARGFIGTLRTLRQNFFALGVTTIFVDRLTQSLSRAWGKLNDIIGVARIGETAEQVLRMATFMDLGTTKLQAFDSAMGTLGKDLDDTRDLLQTFNERVADIKTVTGVAEDFARIGLSAKDFAKSEDAIDKFLIFAQRLQEVSGAERMTAVEAILGGDLSVVGQLGGMEAILKMMDEAIEKGHVLTEQQIKRGAAFQKVYRSMQRTIKSLSDNIGTILAPAIGKTFTIFDENVGRISSHLNRNNERLAASFSKFTEPMLDKIKLFFDEFDGTVKDLGDTFERLLPVMVGLGSALALFFGGQSLAIFLSVAAVFGTIALLVEDIVGFMRDDDSVFGDFVDEMLTFQDESGNTTSVLGDMKSELKGISEELDRLGEGFDGLGSILSWFADMALVVLMDLMLSVLVLIEDVLISLNVILSMFQDIRTFGAKLGLNWMGPGTQFKDPADRRAFEEIANRPFMTLDAIGRFNEEILNPGPAVRIENNIYANDVEGAVTATGMANERLTRAEAGPR